MFSQGEKVAVVYYRAGYSPDHYHGEAEWSARLMIERSKAIKCPNIQYHLAGTKKVCEYYLLRSENFINVGFMRNPKYLI